MPPCDNVFRDLGISFEPSQQDTMVNLVWRYYGRERIYAKWLILCWFDQTFGRWDGQTFNRQDSREKMSQWLDTNGYNDFESILDTTPPEGYADRTDRTNKPKSGDPR